MNLFDLYVANHGLWLMADGRETEYLFEIGGHFSSSSLLLFCGHESHTYSEFLLRRYCKRDGRGLAV